MSRFAIGAVVCMFAAGCGSEPSEKDYSFGELDMQNAIVGHWEGTMSLTGQNPTPFTLDIVQVPALQPACGNRTFSSPLCVDMSSINLEATLTTTDKVFDAVKLTGSFTVLGLGMTSGELSLAGTGVNLASGVEVAKTTHDVTVSGDHPGSATMQR